MAKLGITFHTEITSTRVSVSCDLDQEMSLTDKQAAQLEKKLNASAKLLVTEYHKKAKANKPAPAVA